MGLTLTRCLFLFDVVFFLLIYFYFNWMTSSTFQIHSLSNLIFDRVDSIGFRRCNDLRQYFYNLLNLFLKRFAIRIVF